MEIEPLKSVTDRLENTKILFLDTAPVIYYVEKNERYINSVRTVFDWIDDGRITAITSPITLSECLVHPYRRELKQLQKDFIDLIVYGQNTIFKPIDHIVSQKAAQLRANYNLCLADALQLATALNALCDSFLTNDVDIKRITELDVIVLSEIQAV
jgi:predicted nucleic acid-binding protein